MAMAKVVLVTCLALVCMMILASSKVEANDSYFYDVGTAWIYDLEAESDMMTLTGESTYSIEGTKTETVAGVTYNVYEMRRESSLSIIGDYLGTTVLGTAKVTGSYSMEVEKFDQIRSDINFSMTIKTVGGLYDSWTHTVTTFSPPGGIGDVPDEPEEGVSWVLTYTLHQEITKYNDGEINSDSESYTETRTYTYIGKEQITVPAGTFDCEVFQIEYSDRIETYWFCDHFGAYVKKVSDGTDFSEEWVLKSYSFGPSVSDDDEMIVYLVVGAITATAVVVPMVAFLMLRKKPRTPQMAPSGPGTAPVPIEPPVEPRPPS